MTDDEIAAQVMGDPTAGLTLIYQPGEARHSHWTAPWSEGHNHTICGRYREGGFLGTGSQDEYDKAARLPLCGDCAKRVPTPQPKRENGSGE
jgi:hypothetical protein